MIQKCDGKIREFITITFYHAGKGVVVSILDDGIHNFKANLKFRLILSYHRQVSSTIIQT